MTKASTMFSQLTKHVSDYRKPALNIKIWVYQICILSMLLYGDETWPILIRHE